MTLFDPPPGPASWRPTTPGAADEITVSGDATGKRLLVPERQMLAGMLDHLERSVAAHLTKENRHA